MATRTDGPGGRPLGAFFLCNWLIWQRTDAAGRVSGDASKTTGFGLRLGLTQSPVGAICSNRDGNHNRSPRGLIGAASRSGKRIRSGCRGSEQAKLETEAIDMPVSKGRRGMIARSLMLCILALSLSATDDTAAGELSPVTATTPLALHLPDLEGQVQALDTLRGKLVLVNFWASWCTPCITEMPSIQRLSDDMRDRGFAVIGVNVGEGEPRVRAVVERLGLDFPILLDKDSAAFERLRISVLPTTYLLDGDGVVRYVGRGPLEWDSAEVKRILQDLATAETAPMSQQ